MKKVFLLIFFLLGLYAFFTYESVCTRTCSYLPECDKILLVELFSWLIVAGTAYLIVKEWVRMEKECD